VEIACRLAKSSGATLYLVYVLEVPRTYGLDAALPEEEQMAGDALEAAAAIAAPYKITSVTRMHRVRVAKDGILAFVAEQDIDLLALGARPDESRGLPRELARELFLTARCEVVVDYIAGEQQMPMDEDFDED
jgi:nucleotide-binding universal stress UspA family protein